MPLSPSEITKRRAIRIRSRLKKVGNGRPRLSVKFSGKHIYAQAVNDDAGSTLVFLSTLDPEVKKSGAKSNVSGAKNLGVAFAAKAKAAGISSVVFDRNGRPYHGRVKTFADAAREGGLKF